MKKNRFLLLLTCLLMSCSNSNVTSTPYNTSFIYENCEEEKFNMDIEVRDQYKNRFEEDRIPNQWPSYGVGDPFVYRFNGKYYLYCSTKDRFIGVRAWVSDNMMNWTPVTGEGLQEGYVCEEETTYSAYAPEVIYRDGYFYMCQSTGGNGHYLYRSTKPEGPFVQISDNFNESIDGSFFIDDDEKMYFLRASDNGIVIREFNEDLSFKTPTTITASKMDGWTEGPYLLKRDGIYYLTYTGNHIMSNAYRVSYSYSDENLFNNNYTFKKGDVLLINTDEDFRGLGHSSTVMGPDLDSYYVAYHNLINTTPYRNFNLARLSFNGASMSADTCSLNYNFVPRSPRFSSNNKDGLTKINDKYLSSLSSSSIFSAEYNFIGENASLIFSYIDDNNYNYINVNDNVISLHRVINNIDETIKQIQLNRNYDYSKLHTIRIAYNNTLDVYFDNCRKLNAISIDSPNGLIGYKDNVEIYYTALSDVAKGSSDTLETHQNKISAVDYIYSNIDSPLLNEGVTSYSKSVVLNKDNSLTYPIYIDEGGNYTFDLTINKKYKNAKIKFRLDDGNYIITKIPPFNEVEGNYIRLSLFEEHLHKGLHSLSIIAEEEIEIYDIHFDNALTKTPSVKNNLSKKSDNLIYISDWSVQDGGHISKSSERNILYFPYKKLKNATIEVDLTLITQPGQESVCGLVLRGKNAGLYKTETETGIQGYFCGLSSANTFISKYNFEYSKKDVASEMIYHPTNTKIHLKASIVGNKITFNLTSSEGKINLEYEDDLIFSNGYFGIYSHKCTAKFENLKMY